MGEWKDILVSTLPGLCDTQYGPVIVYNNKIYAIMTNDGYNPTIYSWNGISWNQEIALPEPPYYFTYSSSVVYNNKIHYLVGDSTPSSSDTYHFILDNGNWIQGSSLPYNPYSGSAVIYNNKIHLLGGSKDLQSQEIKYYNDKKHYSWDGTNWIEESTLPYSFTHGNAVVYNNKIHILGCADYQDLTLQHHYSWDGNEWTQETDLPYFFQFGGATVYNNKIHIFGGVNRKDHYTYDGNSWTQETDLPYNLDTGFVVIYNNDINILNGLKHSTQDPEDIHYLIYEEGTKAVNKVIYGDETIIDISNDTVTSNTLVTGSTAHDKNGQLIVGTRPSFYKYCSNNFEYINDNFPIELEITYSEFSYIEGVMKLGNYIINLSYNKLNNNSIELYTNNSSVTIFNNVSNTTTAFKIEKVWYISRNFCIFQHRSYNGGWTVHNLRGLCIKSDGTLVLGTAVTGIGTADSSTATYELNIIPTLLGDKSFDYISCKIATNTSSSSKSLNSFRGYLTGNTAAYKTGAENTVNTNAYVPDLSLAPSKGGYFYKDASGNNSIILINSYGDASTKKVTLANAGSEIATVGAENHYILGYTALGYLLTVKEYDKYYLWDYDQTSTTNLLKPITNFDAFNFGPWKKESILPYDFDNSSLNFGGAVVIYNNKIHILGSTYSSNDKQDKRKHYSWDGTQWTEESTLPFYFYQSSAVVYNNKIHIIGLDYDTFSVLHYSWDGTNWAEETPPPYNFNGRSIVIYDNKIHMLGGTSGYNIYNHYSWDGTNWIEESTLPYLSSPYSLVGDYNAIIYNNKIHIFYNQQNLYHTSTYHSVWDGDSWTSLYMPLFIPNIGMSGITIYNNEIHILSNKKHYSWNGNSWKTLDNISYSFYGSAITYNNNIHIIGSENSHYITNNNRYKILSYKDNVIICSNGKRYQIDGVTFKELEPINITKVTYPTGLPGPESDTINGLFNY